MLRAEPALRSQEVQDHLALLNDLENKWETCAALGKMQPEESRQPTKDKKEEYNYQATVYIWEELNLYD